LEPGEVWLTLRSLHSVLKMDRMEQEICVHHASFLDFLRDHRRSSIFHVGSQQ
ncbi:hypothetical protein B0H17DRAFT_911738, partial [Mycena rosella]